MKKKWFFVILIIAVIAVILTIVFINLFREKDTTDLAKSVHSVTETGYLSDKQENGKPLSEENKVIKDYLTSVYSLVSGEEKNEIKNYLDAFKAFEVYGQFFDRQIVFTEYTNVYKSNRKKIADNLNKAQKAANQLTSYIKENKPAIDNVDFWLAASWADCDSYVAEIINFTIDSFNRLGDVYEASVKSTYMNNDLTKVIFMATEDVLKSLQENLKTDSENGAKLLSLANSYLTINGEKTILKFHENNTAQANVAKILESGKEAAEYEKLLNGTIAV